MEWLRRNSPDDNASIRACMRVRQIDVAAKIDIQVLKPKDSTKLESHPNIGASKNHTYDSEFRSVHKLDLEDSSA